MRVAVPNKKIPLSPFDKGGTYCMHLSFPLCKRGVGGDFTPLHIPKERGLRP